MNKLSESKKRGCPTCEGVDARSCFRCRGKTRMCDWYNTETGWSHYTELDSVERQRLGKGFADHAVAQRRPAAVDEAMVERIAALLYEEAIDEPWTVADIEHLGPDRDYYRGLARKVAALATQYPEHIKVDDFRKFVISTLTDADPVKGPHPSITHCDNCGCDWLDNGLNPIGCPYCKLSADANILAAERDALEARAERLAEALRRYGVHDQACSAWDIPICTCGLDAALEQENKQMTNTLNKPMSEVKPVTVERAREALKWLEDMRGDSAALAKENAMNKSIPEAVVEAVARAICVACEENPDHQGDTRGNEFRWQDYREVALAAISALAAEQQPTEGEEIMVNTPHDVFILPLHPSGLSSGPRFVVHVPELQRESVTVRYDLSSAQTESAIRDALIWMGWTPPAGGAQAALEAVREECGALLYALRQIAEWPDGGNRYGQENIRRFAQAAIDAAMQRTSGGDHD